MFVVLFEVTPHQARWNDYLGYAAALRPELERIDGFLENRRFRSRRHDGRLLSLSLWRDEKALVRWRAHAGHHAIQAKGRSQVFRDYHLRVGEVMRDDAQALAQSRLDETETGAARAVCLLQPGPAEPPPPTDGLVDWDLFDGITVPQDRLLLLSWRDPATMLAWQAPGPGRRLDVRIVRDYGLRDRAEAPQYHP